MRGAVLGLGGWMLAALSSGVAAQETQTFGYDALGRVVSSEARRVGGTGSFTEYKLDPASNRTAVESSGPFIAIQILGGVELARGQSILSSDARFRFVFRHDGNLVLYSQSSLMWQSSTGGSNATKLTMQTDGNLVMRRADNSVVWQTSTGGNTGSKLVVNNNGNVTLLSASQAVLWQTNTCCF